MQDWIWDGGRPSVDLLNTLRDRMAGGRELLRDPVDLAAWLHEAGLPGDPGEADLRAVRRLRTAIDRLAFPEAPGAAPVEAMDAADAAEVVNTAAHAASLVPRVVLDDHGRPAVAPPEPSVAVALARIAADAIDLLAGDELLRVCAADDCGVRFVDRSPARNRQWCSMRRCGNRLKARRHYDRVGRRSS